MGAHSYVGTFVLHGVEDILTDLVEHPHGLSGARMARLLVAAMGRCGWGISKVAATEWGWAADLTTAVDGKLVELRLGVSPERPVPRDPAAHAGHWLVQLHLPSPGVMPKTRIARRAAFTACWEDLKGALDYARAEEIIWDTAAAA